jgi:hypothetical protein
MRHNTIIGGTLIASTLFLIITSLVHPTGGQMLSSPYALEHISMANRFAHGMGILGASLGLFGTVGLSRRLGIHRLDVTGALVMFALATSAVILAALLDGFVITRLLKGYFDMSEAAQAEARRMMTFCFYVASALTWFYVAAVSVALLLWSWAARRVGVSRTLIWLGAFLAVAGFIGLFGGYLRVTVGQLMVIVLGQSAWMVWAGVLLIRSQDSSSGNTLPASPTV